MNGGWQPPPLLDAGEPTATISDDGTYRYDLTRTWGWGDRTVLFVMLNPSTADAATDDPTIRRCTGFARREGADRMVVVNLYAYRATQPADLWGAPDPVGPDNDTHLRSWFAQAARHGWPVIAAWGVHGATGTPRRDTHVTALAAEHGCSLSALGVTGSGAPRHPLYVPATQPLAPWPPAPPAP